MAGRKPLPTHLKLVKGTARSHRLNKKEPKLPLVAPEPPDHLDERAKAMAVYMGGGPSLMYAADAMRSFEQFNIQE
jgi:hypothetical protein